MQEAIQAIVTAFCAVVLLVTILKVMRAQQVQLQLLMYLKNQIEHLRRGSKEFRKTATMPSGPEEEVVEPQSPEQGVAPKREGDSAPRRAGR